MFTMFFWMGTDISEESAASSRMIECKDEGSRFLQNGGTYYQSVQHNIHFSSVSDSS